MRLRSAGSLATSVLLHVGVLASGAWLLSRSLAADASPKAARLVEVALVDDAAGALRGSTLGEIAGVPAPTQRPEPREPRANGGERTPPPAGPRHRAPPPRRGPISSTPVAAARRRARAH
jgi:hypothetical protein